MYHDYPWFCKAEVNIPNLTWALFNSEEYCIYKLRLRKVDAVAFSKERIVLGTGLRSCGSHGSYVPWFFVGYGWQMMSIAILYIQDSTRFLSCNEGMDILKNMTFPVSKCRRCLGTFLFFHSFQWLRSCEVKGMSPYLEITILRHTHKTQWGFCVTGPIVIIIAFFGGGGRKEAKLSFRLFHFTSKHWRALIPHPPKRGWIIREFWTCIFCLPCLPWLRSNSWILRILNFFSSPALIFHRIPSSGHVFF